MNRETDTRVNVRSTQKGEIKVISVLVSHHPRDEGADLLKLLSKSSLVVAGAKKLVQPVKNSLQLLVTR